MTTDKRRGMVALILGIALIGALVALPQLSNPPDANALSYRYYAIPDSTSTSVTPAQQAAWQVDAIVYHYPIRAVVWPQRRIATSYAYAKDNQSSLQCLTTIYIKAVCRGWRASGPTGQFDIGMGVDVNWTAVSPGEKDEGWYNIRYRVYCNPLQAITVTLNQITCGLLSHNTATLTFGYYFSTTTQSFGFYPQVTVWWRSYIVCRRYDGYCYEPYTVPAG